jgi:ribosomal protein S18 acetylase RimI-like enzyme
LAEVGAQHLGVSECSLFVAADNVSAIQLYGKLGFVRTEYPEDDPSVTSFPYMVAPKAKLIEWELGAQCDPMQTRPQNVVLRLARADDLARLEHVRAAAFAPVFASFRSILGEDIYRLAQAREDEAQGALLASLLAPDSSWELYVAEQDGVAVGFVSVQLNRETQVGEIGLNAVHPTCAGKGIGTLMYDFAIGRMKECGMRVATVATGGDPSHAPARRAYEKAGFTVQIPSVWMCRKL